MTESMKKPCNFKLSSECLSIMDGFAQKMATSRTGVIELIMREPQVFVKLSCHSDDHNANTPVAETVSYQPEPPEPAQKFSHPDQQASKPAVPRPVQRKKMKSAKEVAMLMSNKDRGFNIRLARCCDQLGQSSWMGPYATQPAIFRTVIEQLFENGPVLKNAEFLRAIWMHIPELMEHTDMERPAGIPLFEETSRACTPLLPIDEDKVMRIQKAALQAGLAARFDHFERHQRYDDMVDEMAAIAASGDQKVMGALADYLPEVEL